MSTQTDPLEAQEADILLKLSLLSDANSANYDKEGSKGILESKPPPGFDENDLEASESRGRSLWAYHTTQLAKARQKGPSKRLRAIAAAIEDHETATKRPEPILGVNLRDWSILRWKGRRSEWVATVEGCSDRTVKRHRKKAGLNETTGEPA